MKLYELPRIEDGVKIYLPRDWVLKTDDEKALLIEYVTFWHIDGAYSYCTTPNGDVVHLSASTPIVKHEDGYKIEGSR